MKPNYAQTISITSLPRASPATTMKDSIDKINAKPLESDNKHPVPMKPANHTSPQAARQPLLSTPPASAYINSTQQLLKRPPNGVINSENITGPSNCATNKQQETPLLQIPPHHHIIPRPIIMRPYQQQNPQITHHPIYVPVIILTLTDQFINLIAHQAKLTHPTPSTDHHHHQTTSQR